ncbi:hypothetical protein [Duganella guangzhouensis]|nr:hypothetical protein [Duganella guangzhouensis]
MKTVHIPAVNPRYWTAITLASICGTNLGDLYAHTTHLGIMQGLLILCVIAAAVFAAERADQRVHEAYYWLVILIIRTGATNIADYLAFRVHIPMPVLIVGLAAALAMLAWRTRRDAATASVPNTDAAYWIAMLIAGVFGTVSGDALSHLIGQGYASICLSLLLAAVLWWNPGAGAYWLIVATARTAGTAIGDWLAENQLMNIGLPLCTLITVCVFASVLFYSPSVARARMQ